MKKVASDERRVLKASDLPKSVLGSAPSITVVFDNCVALRQESLATFVRTLEGVKPSSPITAATQQHQNPLPQSPEPAPPA